MVFYNNNRVDHAFLNNANIVAIGMGTNNPALVYNNAATAAYINAIGGNADTRVYNFEIVNFNTLGIDNIDLVVPFHNLTTYMNKSATMYYNNARNNCLIENTVKDIDLNNLKHYGFCSANFAPLSLNSLKVAGTDANPAGVYSAKYVVCNAQHGGSSMARWYATEKLSGYPRGRIPAHSNMAAGNVISLNGDYCFFSQYTGYAVDQLNITNAKTLSLNNFNGGNFWENAGGVRVISGVHLAAIRDSHNICSVNANSVYVNTSNNINYISGNYVQLGNKVAYYSVSNVRNIICYNLNSYGSDIRANVSYFADVDLGTTLSNVILYANHANINGGFYVNANLYSNNASSYINNTATGRFILNHNTYLENVRNSNVIMLGNSNLNRVNNCQNSTFWLDSYNANIYNTYNAFRNGTIYLHENYNYFSWALVSALTRKDAFFNTNIYNANVTNTAVLVNYGPKNFTWSSYTDPAVFAEEFSYSAYPIISNASSNARAYLNVMLPCGSNLTGTCLVLGNALNVSSYELHTEMFMRPNNYVTNDGKFGPYAYYHHNGHDTYICSSNLNNFNNRKFIVMGLGEGNVSYPNGIAVEKYLDATNTALLRYMVPNCTVANANMVHIPLTAAPLNNNWVRFRNCGPVYIMSENAKTQYGFTDTPNACIRGSGQYYIYSNMNLSFYNAYERNFYISDSVGEVHFDVKGTSEYYVRLGNIILYNEATTWNKNTSIYINAYECKSLVYLGLSQFQYQDKNLNNAKAINIRMQNCVHVGDFNINANFYFNNTNIYINNCVLTSTSAGRRVNIFTEYSSRIIIVNTVAQYPITLAKGTNVNITLTNCTNITVV